MNDLITQIPCPACSLPMQVIGTPVREDNKVIMKLEIVSCANDCMNRY